MKQLLLLILTVWIARAQCQDTTINSNKTRPLKISHAEPIYMDLIRDLGARSGEKEWNTGFGMQNHKSASVYTGFVEYEFSPLNRLGLEAEVPFILSRPGEKKGSGNAAPSIEGIKLASQYTFLVSQKYQLSMAAGHLYELELSSSTFSSYQISGQWYNPFLIVAKKWGSQFHSLVYSGPVYEHNGKSLDHFGYQLNASLFYMLPGTKNFVGLELNQERIGNNVNTVLRPEVKIKLAPGLAIGLATGITLGNPGEGLSFFSRLIYEPFRKK